MKVKLRIRNGISRSILLEGITELPRSAIDSNLQLHLGPTQTLGTFEWKETDESGTDIFELTRIDPINP